MTPPTQAASYVPHLATIDIFRGLAMVDISQES